MFKKNHQDIESINKELLLKQIFSYFYNHNRTMKVVIHVHIMVTVALSMRNVALTGATATCYVLLMPVKCEINKNKSCLTKLHCSLEMKEKFVFNILS